MAPGLVILPSEFLLAPPTAATTAPWASCDPGGRSEHEAAGTSVRAGQDVT